MVTITTKRGRDHENTRAAPLTLQLGPDFASRGLGWSWMPSGSRYVFGLSAFVPGAQLACDWVAPKLA
jgi:hypothetical protein